MLLLGDWSNVFPATAPRERKERNWLNHTGIWNKEKKKDSKLDVRVDDECCWLLCSLRFNFCKVDSVHREKEQDPGGLSSIIRPPVHLWHSTGISSVVPTTNPWVISNLFLSLKKKIEEPPHTCVFFHCPLFPLEKLQRELIFKSFRI